MEANNNFDDYLRQRLDGHEILPPPYQAGKLPVPVPISKPWFRNTIFIAAVLIVAIFISGILIIFQNKQTASNSVLPVHKNTIQSVDKEANTELLTKEASLPDENFPLQPLNKPINNQANQKEIIDQPASRIILAEFQRINMIPLREQRFSLVPKTLLNRKTDLRVMLPKTTDETNSSAIRVKTRPEQSLSAGLFFTPEWLFNTTGLDAKNMRSAGLEINYQLHRYSIRMGMGISHNRSNEEWDMAYQSYLGSYQKLDSMSFMYDAENHVLVPKYYLSDVTIYDERIENEKSIVSSTYTYLQIPLVMGYDFAEWKNLSFGLRAGPQLSLLIDASNSEPTYDAGNNRVISMTNISPDRLKTNWQFTAGPICNMWFGKGLSLQLEPHLKYYFNSVYEKATTDKPFAFGMRASVLIQL
ncbi:MAG: outer membrane beta-barrel protein [Bacteroidales bacterium]|jgi:hypothetical protein|nr:outer membrane beta-barrel protein [Bacteroidales bacterium]